ncbi:hybrid sensor histidine kinase/response regulator [Planctomicrobium piriforme]|uniref:hybrid sensor histidine kinase/response regulator n=1 Tax=Planctomicrobium piriforme TaxID=1576369 RepID=UPI001113D8E0|nr:response regulator [Planctomicrobium piriforme]
MPEQVEVLVFGVEPSTLSPVIDGLKGHCRLTAADSLGDALERLKGESPPGFCLVGNHEGGTGLILEATGLLDRFPEAVVLLNDREEILWANTLASQVLNFSSHNGKRARLFDVWEDAEIVGQNFCPVNTVLVTGCQAKTRVRVNDKTFYDVTVSPVTSRVTDGQQLLLATLRDNSEEILQQQKLNAIYKAGLDLGDLQPEEVLELSTHDRIELLKSKLRYYTQELLEFETVEVRIIDQASNTLRPLLALGMDPTAEQRTLKVSAEGNGVTGFVAATGRSYLCENTTTDPLYLVGATGARSSLTVPLIRHDQVLGTFNVESFRPGAFSQTDLQFLELFCREVAVALNTLDLLMAEKATTVEESTKRVLCEVADPVDDILNDTSWIYEKYGEQDPQVRERLKRVLQHTQDIRELIRQAGSSIYTESGAAILKKPSHPNLAGKRVLVMDKERDIRHSAHEILERFDVVVETARDGEQALRMARTFHYDAVICDIKPPDMGGSELYRRLRETHEHTPVILMTGFGYDGEHTLVRARQLGLKSVLYKPFILNQLLKALEDAVCPAM